MPDLDLNIIERGIAALSPFWGAQRLANKVALHQARAHVRGFDAARRDRRTDGWRATRGSANAELAPALGLVIARSRDLARNNEFVINAKAKWKGHLVGAGVVSRPFGVKGRAKKAASDAWESFVENCDPQRLTDWNGIQAMLVGEVFEAGAAFLRWYPRPSSMGLKVPLQCEVLEHDHLDANKTEILDAGKGNVVIHGVEYDGFGQRVAYWLFPTHPGEVSIVRRASFVSQRVAAEYCDHVFRIDRPGQVTGVPWTAPVMLRVRDTADYEEAELIRKKIEACFTAFVRRGNGAQGVAQAADQSTDTSNRRIEKIAPGLIAYIEGEGDIQFASPTPSSDNGHIDRQQSSMALGLLLPRASATGDLTKVNFSSQRAGVIDFHPVLDQLQWHMVMPQMCRPAWRRVMRSASARGLNVSADTKAKHAFPKRPYVNPVDDVRAAAAELVLGLDSWSEKVAAAGHDPEELLADIKEWRAKMIAAGVDPGLAPGIAGAGSKPADKNEDGSGKPPKPADVASEDDNDDKD